MTLRLLIAEIGLPIVASAPLWAFVRWRRGEPIGRVLLSTGLFMFVGLQLVFGLMPTDDPWPLTGYPMYAWRPAPGPQETLALRFSGTTRAGAEIDIPASEIYVDTNDLVDRALPGLQDASTSTALAATFVDYYNAAHPDPNARLTALRISLDRQQWSADYKPAGVTTEPLVTYRQ